jgi:hypothetical protein
LLGDADDRGDPELRNVKPPGHREVLTSTFQYILKVILLRHIIQLIPVRFNKILLEFSLLVTKNSLINVEILGRLAQSHYLPHLSASSVPEFSMMSLAQLMWLKVSSPEDPVHKTKQATCHCSLSVNFGQ